MNALSDTAVRQPGEASIEAGKDLETKVIVIGTGTQRRTGSLA